MTVAEVALKEILNLGKVTLAEAEKSPELFKKYNQVLKIARKANVDLERD